MTRKELIQQIREKQSFLCVGLDTDLNKIPKSLKNIVKKEYEEEEYTFGMLLEFNTRIIDATAPYCVAYKPNLAFYEAYGMEGIAAFEGTIEYLKENYPHHFIIADAKRGDIGNTSAMYAKTFFEEYDIDALTVAPYMGEDSVTPFLGYDGKWVVLLALTSNKGSQDFQLMADANGERLFEKVLKKSQQWGNQDRSTFGRSASAENSLACVLSIAYYYAKNDYVMHRELTTGKGFADIVLIPRKNVDSPAIVLELKVNKDADTAISQILRKNYPVKVREYSDRLLLVGINYDRDTKQHTCRIVKP